MTDKQRQALYALLDAQQRYTLALAQCHACGADQIDLTDAGDLDAADQFLLKELVGSDAALEYQLSLNPRS